MYRYCVMHTIGSVVLPILKRGEAVLEGGGGGYNVLGVTVLVRCRVQ